MKKPPHYWLFPISLVMYEISMYLSNDMYLPALPDMIKDLSISATEAQLTITMWFLGSASMPLVMGALADRFGRRPTLLIGGLIYILSTMLCAIATNEYNLLAPRVLQGAMVSSMMVAGYASIHEMYDHKEAIRMLAILGSISILAPALGPLFGALLLLIGSWRWIFWFIAIYSSIGIFCLYHFMPETLLPEKRQSLHFGTLIKNYWSIATNTSFLVLTTILGFTFAGFIAWITAGPLLVIDNYHYSAISYGYMQVAVFLAFILGNHTVNKLIETYDTYLLVKFGLGVTLAGGLLMLPFTIFFPQQFDLFLLAMVIYSFGAAVCFAPLNRLIIETSDLPMGVRVAMFTVGFTMFGVLGSAVASVLYNGNSLALSVMIAACIIASSLLSLFVKRKDSR